MLGFQRSTSLLSGVDRAWHSIPAIQDLGLATPTAPKGAEVQPSRLQILEQRAYDAGVLRRPSRKLNTILLPSVLMPRATIIGPIPAGPA